MQSHHFMANRWGNKEAVRDFIFLGFKENLCLGETETAAMKLKDACSLEEKLDKRQTLTAYKKAETSFCQERSI